MKGYLKVIQRPILLLLTDHRHCQSPSLQVSDVLTGHVGKQYDWLGHLPQRL